MLKTVAQQQVPEQVKSVTPVGELTAEEWRLIRCYRQLKAQEQDFFRRALEALVAPPR